MSEDNRPLQVTQESIAAVNHEFGIDVGSKMLARGYWKLIEPKKERL